MDSDHDNTPINDDELIFADEETTSSQNDELKATWKIVIADDDEEIHNITKMVLEDYSFDGQSITFLSGHSSEETIQILKDNPDAAIILLDVVMETEDAGLNLAKYIREELKNSFIRIILRTGQPGKAPEERVITEYDINDYKEKTELTTQKLFTTITSSLRAYRDLRTIEKNRIGLEKIIDSSRFLFDTRSLRQFAEGLLTQLLSLLNLDESSIYLQTSSFAASQEKDSLVILAATGKFQKSIDKTVDEVIPKNVICCLEKAILEKRSVFESDSYLGYFPSKSGVKNLLYVKGARNLSELDKNLIQIFSTNVAIAFENIYLNRDIVDTQKEVIIKLGEVVETRSQETANHVRRVAELSYLLALKADLNEEEPELLRNASPMHDVGKVGIPDVILLKPGKLTPEEFEVIRSHTKIGFDILKNSNREIINAAAIVAYQHHEHWDGTGYPQGLKGEDIHIFGRITGLIDVFDALSHKREYKEAWDIKRVFNHIKQERGNHFDPNLVDLFFEHINDFINICNKYPEPTINWEETKIAMNL